MPYISKDRRKMYDEVISKLNISLIGEPIGDLNYIITRLCDGWMKETGENYATHNAIIGVLESAKMEYYRRLVVVYEENKRDKNGDVF